MMKRVIGDELEFPYPCRTCGKKIYSGILAHCDSCRTAGRDIEEYRKLMSKPIKDGANA